jgi:hypothetical protein
MGRRGRLLIRRLALLCAVWLTAAAAVGQDSRPVDAELPPAVRAALDQTENGCFNFAQPGFYAVVDFVRHCPHSPGFRETPLAVHNWHDLLERALDLRGRVVTITGTVGRNKDPYTLQTHPELGPLCQLELHRPDQPITCTIICTENAAAVPVGAELEITGYFVMIRRYLGPSQRQQQAALIVAPGPSVISLAAPRATDPGTLDWRWMMSAVVAGILVTLWLLRWSRRAAHRDPHTLRAERTAPMNLADDLADWAASEPPPGADERRPLP